MAEANEENEGKWQPRRGAAIALRIVIFLIPVVLSVLGTAVISKALPPPGTAAVLVLFWVLLSIVATAILYMTDKAARQLLPLHTLLNLSLIFPDRAPSRFRAAMRSSTVRQLERKIADVKANGLGDSETEAAETLIELVGALGHHDRLTRGHAERVRAYSRMIGEEMGIDDEDLNKLTWAGLLHDVGKLFVPSEILNKPGKLTDEEFEIIKTHPAAGAELVAPLAGWLGDWVRAVGEHHERWDGNGYPAGLSGEKIALAARIVAVADTFDVLTSARSYKAPCSPAKARAEIQRCAGTQFDATVVRAFLNISVGRFRLVMGPLSWLAQAPVVGIPLAPAVGAMAGGFATAAGLLVGGMFQPPELPRDTTEVIAAPQFPGPSPTFPVSTTASTARPSTSTSSTSTSSTSTTVRSNSPSTTVRESIADSFESTSPSASGPVIELVDDLLSGTEDFPAIVSPLDNDPGGLTLASVSQPSIGSITVLPNGTVRFNPPTNWWGTTSFTYKAGHTNGNIYSSKVTVDYAPTPDAPQTEADFLVRPEDSAPTTIDVTANDSDPDFDPIRVIAISRVPSASAAIGTVSITSSGDVRFAPKPDANGVDRFIYFVSDPGGLTQSNVLTVTLTPVNDPPVARNDVGSMNEDTTKTFAVRSNDFDIDGGALTTTNVSSSDGTATTNGTTVTYRPAPDSFGTHRVRYTINDGRGGTASATLTISVAPVNDPPVARNDVGSMNEDTTAAFAVLTNDSDIDGGALSVTSASSSTGAASTNGSTVTYSPASNSNGVHQVDYVVSDGRGGTATARLTINVIAVNDPPTFTKGPDDTVAEDSGPRTRTGWATNISAGPPDESSQTVTFSVTAADPTLFSAQPAINATTGTLTYTPAPDANGISDITIVLSDSGGASSAPQTAQIVVTHVNDPPTFTKGPDDTVAEDSGPRTRAGWATNISAGPPNESSQTVTFTVTAATPSLFSVQPAINSTTGTLTYTPAPNAHGATDLTITLTDSQGGTSAPKTARVTITPVNDPPSFVGGADDSVDEDSGPRSVPGWATAISAGPNEASQTVTFAVTADDTTLFSSQPAINSTTGTLTYTPAPDANGIATISVTLTDSEGATTPAQTALIIINHVNDPPTFEVGADEVVDEDSGPQTVPGWATAISAGPANESNQTLTFSVTADDTTLFSSQPAINATTGTLTYTPAPDANGATDLTITLTDSQGGTSAAQTTTVTVNPVNDDPSFTAGSDDTVAEDSGPRTVAAWATAISAGAANESSQTLTFDVTADDPSLFATQPAISATTGDLTYTPANNQNGTATITVTLTDSAGGTSAPATADITITIAAVNTNPTIGGTGAATVNTSGSVTITAAMLSASDPDLPAQPLTFTLATAPVNGAVERSGSPLAAGATFTPAQVAAGNISYRHSGAASSFDAFSITVSDGAGGSDGPTTFTITVLGVSPSAITISEIRTDSILGGDYVELYNGSGAAINLSAGGWVLDIEDLNGALVETVTLSGVVPAERYVLITEAIYIGLGTPDARSTLGAFDRGFGFRVRQGATVIDAVGTSSGSSWAEGTPLPRMGGVLPQAYHRLNGTGRGACVDTDDNAADFVHLWGLTSFSPRGIADGAATPCLPAAPPAPAPSPATHPVIREYRTDGPGGGSDEFIEIFNPGPDQVMTNWTVELNKPPFQVVYTFPTGFVLRSGRHYLLAGAGYTGAAAPDGAIVASVTNGTGVILWRGGPGPGSGLIDALGIESGSSWYEPSFGWGLPRIDGRTYHSYERKNNGCTDTDNNLADFEHHLGFDTPTNNSAGVFPCV